MKIIIAPDSFKESLDATAVATCIENGFKDIFPEAEYIKIPLADGGEGTVDVLLQGLQGDKKYITVQGPLGQPVEAMWAMIPASKNNKKATALIEIAAASGLDLIPSEQRNPLTASTYGTGQLIKHAINEGAQKIILGLGGSATNDGGAGIAQALGAQLYCSSNQALMPGGLALNKLTKIDLSQVESKYKQIEFVVACDVGNPLCGPEGASFIFGPQKGATTNDTQALDNALKHFAATAKKSGLEDHQSTPGYGAAGGAPLGLNLIFDIQIKAGIDIVLDILNVDGSLTDADLLITGEGQMDNQTLQGKAPYGIAKRASLKGIPSIAIAGSLGKEVEALYAQIHSVFGTVRSPQMLSQVLSEAESNLTRTARNVAATLKLGKQIL